MHSSSSDFFADIATAGLGDSRDVLAVPPSAPIPDIVLPLTPGEPASPFPQAEKITDREAMSAALADLRERYLPFMGDLAPALSDTRERLEFSRFQWRIETPEDRVRFAEALAGAGDWQDITLPHYGPPLGKAFTLYRSEFECPSWAARKDVMRLKFSGVDYKCQVYLNGLCIGTHEGFFEEFQMDCSPALRPGCNALVIRVENDFTMLGGNTGGITADGDKIYAATGLGYNEPTLGWHHCPAGMGIWNRVILEGVSRLFIGDLWVRPLPESGEIEIHAEVESRSEDLEEAVALHVSVYGQNFEAMVHQDHAHHGEAKFVMGFGDLVHGFDEFFPSLMGSGRNYIKFRLPLPEPRLWSPETPWLYQLQARLVDSAGILLDTAKTQFGMRSFVQDEESTPKGKFYLNGTEIRLRGANTMGNFERWIMEGRMDELRDQILLAKLTHMNFLRMTQRPVHREFYDYCDRLGMMLQTDLPLFSSIRRSQFEEVVRQAGCLEKHVRSHCSNIIVSFINEPRPAAASKPHRFLHRDEMEKLFDMAANCVRFHNPDRVLKYVDGDYDPPASAGMPDNHVYCGWYIGHGIDLGALHQGKWLPVKPGWHFGCGEYGAEGLDSYEVMSQEYPDEWKPTSPDAPWSPQVISMSQTWKFHFLWYDAGLSARTWIEASQDFQEWVISMMTQAYRRMPWMNSFAVHLFIDAWPAGWMKSLMDVRAIPKKAWFAFRDALTPLSVILRSDRTQVCGGQSLPVELWVCNDLPDSPARLELRYQVTMGEQVVCHGCAPAHASACAPKCHGVLVVDVPRVMARSRLEIRAALVEESGRALHDHCLAFEVFPEVVPSGSQAWCPGMSETLHRFLNRIGVHATDHWRSDLALVVIESPEELERHREEIQRAVQAGATAVMLRFPPGEYRVGCVEFQIRQAGMGPRHFVSRATGHPLVEGFGKNDFRFWFHESLNRVAPLLETVIEAADWKPILLTGDGGWTKPWAYYPAAAEISDGAGSWRICQVELVDCVQGNPAAREFASRLIRCKGTTRRHEALIEGH
jgi:hypothetical protein